MDISEKMVRLFDIAASEGFTDLLAAIGVFAAEASKKNSVEFVAMWKIPCRELLFLKVKSGEKPAAVEFDTTDKSYFINWEINEESGCFYYDEERFDLPSSAISAIESAVKINVESASKKVDWGIEATSRIMGIANHDFGNTFGTIAGIMQLLEIDESENKRVKGTLDSIKEILSGFDDSNKLIMRILRNEPINYSTNLVDISKIYNEILVKNKKNYAYSKIDLKFNVEENIKTKGDEQKITRILSELLTNASDSFENSDDGGKISVKVFVENSDLVIKVDDSGFGMDYDSQRYLTTKFFTRKFKRPGLGLTRVRRFVEDWGGCLQFASTPEKGTSISASFPIVL